MKNRINRLALLPWLVLMLMFAMSVIASAAPSGAPAIKLTASATRENGVLLVWTGQPSTEGSTLRYAIYRSDNGAEYKRISAANGVGKATSSLRDIYYWDKTASAPLSTYTYKIVPQEGTTGPEYPDYTSNVETVTISPNKFNVALAANGGSILAANPANHSANSEPEKAIDGVITNASRWVLSAADASPSLEIKFGKSYSIDSIELYSGNGTDNTSACLTAFDLSYWNGEGWVIIPECTVSDSNANMTAGYSFSFDPIETDRIKLQVNFNTVVRLWEIAAYAAPETGQVLPPNAPSVKAKSDEAVTVQWEPSESISYAGYKLYQDDVFVGQVDRNTLSYTFSGLESGTQYNFAVTAFAESIEQRDDSEKTVLQASTDTELANADINLKVANDGSRISSITIEWNEVTNATYDLYVNGKLMELGLSQGQVSYTHNVDIYLNNCETGIENVYSVVVNTAGAKTKSNKLTAYTMTNIAAHITTITGGPSTGTYPFRSAVDSDFATRWLNQNANKLDEMYLVMELNMPSTIHGFALYSGYIPSANHNKDMTVYVGKANCTGIYDTEASHWELVIDKAPIGGKFGIVELDTPVTQAKYLKVMFGESGGTNHARINEFQIFGTGVYAVSSVTIDGDVAKISMLNDGTISNTADSTIYVAGYSDIYDTGSNFVGSKLTQVNRYNPAEFEHRETIEIPLGKTTTRINAFLWNDKTMELISRSKKATRTLPTPPVVGP